MFAMIDQLAKLLVQPQDTAAQRAQFQTALQQGLGTLQAAEDQLIDTRSGIGIRLNAIDDALDVAAAQSEHAATAASNLRDTDRSEEPTSELQSLMRTSYAVLYLKKKTTHRKHTT